MQLIIQNRGLRTEIHTKLCIWQYKYTECLLNKSADLIEIIKLQNLSINHLKFRQIKLNTI